MLLRAIALVESGRVGPSGRVSPWAWTIDADGVAHIYDNKADAVAAAKDFLADGTRSLDIGCMQVNWQAHGDQFASIDDAFDPVRNTHYAAHFLKALYRRTSSWPQAAMAYHSSRPSLGRAYGQKVMAMWPLADRYREDVMKPEFDNATVETAGDASENDTQADPNAAPLLTAWLKQNSDDVARLQMDHQLLRD